MKISFLNEPHRKSITLHLPRKPHRLNTQAAHREHLMAVDRQRLKLSERGFVARVKAWAWENLND